MKFRCERDVLVEALGTATRAVASRGGALPVLSGVKAELTHGGVTSRRGRSDARHHLLDPVIVAGPWVAGALLAGRGVRKVVGALRG